MVDLAKQNVLPRLRLGEVVLEALPFDGHAQEIGSALKEGEVMRGELVL